MVRWRSLSLKSWDAGNQHMNRGPILSQSLFLALLILHSFAGYAFCHLLYLQFRQYRLGRPVWGGWAWRVLTLVFAIHYLNQMWIFLSFTLSDGTVARTLFAANVAHVITRPLIGPLLMQLFYVTERNRLPEPWWWQAMVRTAWALAVPIAFIRGLWILGVTMPWAKLPDQLIAVSDLILAGAGIFSFAVIRLSRRSDDSPFRRRHRQLYLVIVCAWFLSLALEFVWWPPWVDTLAGFFLPLAFVLVTVYYGERLTFFDVFAKRGLLFLAALVILTCHFALIAPHLKFRKLIFAQYWMTALTLVPFVLATPWLYSKLNSWIDRGWLGRRFSSAGAEESFAESLRDAVNEEDLLERSESSLSYIFQSKACIDFGDPEAVAAESGGIREAVQMDGVGWGVVRVFPRPDGVPFLSEDAKLLRALAGTLGARLDSQRQRDERRSREQREQQLVLSAANSELKALRARINPHFLFNALNAIAALIPQKPERAEHTVEQLADVFRYTVRRADREWVCLAEEIEFVRSYLEIEQTRFGERLRVRIDVENGAGNVRIPAMIIQTLAENAIKHGISLVRGIGVIAISARITGDGRDRESVVVSVSDNGPGFEGNTGRDALPSSGGGYGLKNIQERLSAHYGANAGLRFRRDHGAATTVVSFEIPAVVDPAGMD
jgi:two-component sensor histidine kinase